MKYVLNILFVSIFFQGFSQNYFDIANLTYTNTPSNDFEVSNAQTTVEELAFEFNFPVILNEKTTFLTGLFTNKTKLKLDPNMASSNLNVLGLNLGVNKIFNSKWSGSFIFFPKIAADKIQFSNGNYQLALLSLLTNKKRDDLKHKYGFYANTEKYGLLIVPIFGIYYVSPNKKFEANLFLPIMGDINYRLNKTVWLGMKFDGLGTTYNMNTKIYSTNGSYVSKVSNEIVSYLRFKLNKSIYVNTKVGYAIRRSYEVYDSNDKISLALGPFYFGDNRILLNEPFKDGAIFKVELFYRLHFD